MTHRDKHMVHRLCNTKLGLTKGFMCASQRAGRPRTARRHRRLRQNQRRQPMQLIRVYDLVRLCIGFMRMPQPAGAPNAHSQQPSPPAPKPAPVSCALAQAHAQAALDLAAAVHVPDQAHAPDVPVRVRMRCPGSLEQPAGGARWRLPEPPARG